jgi:hypothetical protein
METKCYACAATASKTCERCGIPSCEQHLKGIRADVPAGKRYQLLCQGCLSDAEKEETSRAWIAWIFLILFIGVCIVAAGFQFGWFFR